MEVSFILEVGVLHFLSSSGSLVKNITERKDYSDALLKSEMFPSGFFFFQGALAAAKAHNVLK